MSHSLKRVGWEGSLRDWIDFALEEYPAPELLRDCQRWLIEQVSRAHNIVPFRLVSGRAPKGAEFVRQDGTILYAADNEPVAGLWGLVAQRDCAPDVDMRELLERRSIPGSWPPKTKPTRFTCRWGPAPLPLKDRGMKIAHLIDSGRNPIPVQPEHLARRALLTLSFVNCFPMPNRAVVAFSRNGMATDDLAERPEVQSLLLSFVAEYVGAELIEQLFVAHGPDCRVALDPDWARKASEFHFGVVPKTLGTTATRPVTSRTAWQRTPSGGARAYVPTGEIFADLYAVVSEVKRWLETYAEADRPERLDDRPGRGNPKAYIRFQVSHLADSHMHLERPHFPGTSLSAADFTGVFRLNGDTKTQALQQLISMAEDGLEIDEILEPNLTEIRTIQGKLAGEKPRFILAGREAADGLYCYPA